MSDLKYPDLTPVDKTIKRLEQRYGDLLWDDPDHADSMDAIDIMRELDTLYAARQRGELYVPNF